ncbi:MAG TPA: SGNH/GDSL hydrolase family protein [Bacillota bacterium]|jgi:lysophospholipase L1-like esterase|nr:SGNH/GDSL hydrolase family protein [Bacillota bacterium]
MSLIVLITLCSILLSVACSPTSIEEMAGKTSTSDPDGDEALPPPTMTAMASTTPSTSVATTTTTTTAPPPQADRSAAYIYELNPKLTPVNYDSPALLPPSEDMGMEYIDRITFICDSPTYWMWPLGLFSDGKDSKQIWTGPEGTMTLAYQSTYHILDPYDKKQRPIRDMVSLHPPDILIIALGINGISFMDEAYFTKEYKDLVTDIQEISPDTIIILQSIYPITRRYKHYGSITNAKITKGNSWILAMAEELGCSYLDTFSVLLNDEGMAKDELMLKDGLHPNREGLTLILDYIRTHAYVER